MSWRANLPGVVVCASLATACADINIARPVPYKYTALQYAQVGSVDSLRLVSQADSQPIQTFKLQSSQQRATRTSTYGFAVMIRNRAINKPLCEALTRNLSFLSEETRRAWNAGDVPTGFRDTILYDARSQEELEKIERPETFSSSDCDEIVAHLDYPHVFTLATRLGFKFTSQGPWLIAVDPVDGYAIIYNLAKEPDLDRAIDRWTGILQDVTAWRNRGYGYWDHLLKLFGYGPEITVVRLPRNFN
jgi:hypothetical protein